MLYYQLAWLRQHSRSSVKRHILHLLGSLQLVNVFKTLRKSITFFVFLFIRSSVTIEQPGWGWKSVQRSRTTPRFIYTTFYDVASLDHKQSRTVRRSLFHNAIFPPGYRRRRRDVDTGNTFLLPFPRTRKCSSGRLSLWAWRWFPVYFLLLFSFTELFDIQDIFYSIGSHLVCLWLRFKRPFW